jgi:7-carboxy-7-deazaguanine synthase
MGRAPRGPANRSGCPLTPRRSLDFQLKFVVTEPEDIQEINDLVDRLRSVTDSAIEDRNVLLMPEGTTSEELPETRPETATLATEHGYRYRYRYTPRLYVNLWNDAPGR